MRVQEVLWILSHTTATAKSGMKIILIPARGNTLIGKLLNKIFSE